MIILTILSVIQGDCKKKKKEKKIPGPSDITPIK